VIEAEGLMLKPYAMTEMLRHVVELAAAA